MSKRSTEIAERVRVGGAGGSFDSPHPAPSRRTRSTATAIGVRRFSPSRIGGFSTLTVLAVISVYPFVWMVLTSLRDRNTVFTGPFIPEHFQVSAYPDSWRETNFGHHLRNSLVIAGLSLAGIMVLSTVAGYAFAKLRFPFKRTIYILLLSTMAMPATSLVIPLYLQVKRLGLLDTTLGLILVYVGSMSPFSIFLMRSFFATLPDDLIEAARIDGAGELTIFRKVMLPLAKAGIGTVVILQFLPLWNEFLDANVLLQNPDKHPLQPVIFNLVGQFNTPWNLLTAALTMAIVPVVVVYVRMQKQFAAGLTIGAIK
jgi:multiple sugar transport system permease protein/raffinose/stachyose/melibiose transport system permease protein